MKKLLLLTFVLMSAVLFAFSASAKNQVINIDADIIINDDGSADIYQTWQCNFAQDTEVYYFFPDEGRYKIRGFVVWDEDKTYETVSDWDTSLSFIEKAGKCGILEYNDGYELCWGITEYGTKTYYVYFKIDNLVTAYKDADATYFCLFSDNVTTRPTYATVKISLANGKKLTDAGIFTDGEFISEGNCTVRRNLYEYYGEFEDGAFVTKTDFPMTNVDFMAFSFIFEKGLINPVNSKYGSAEKSDDKYFNKYVEDSFWEIMKEIFTLTPDNELGLLLVGLLIGVGLPVAIYYGVRIGYKLYLRHLTKKPELNKNEPTFGIVGSYLILKDFRQCETKELLTLIILDMINIGAITPMPYDPTNPVPVKKGNVNFRVNPLSEGNDPTELQKLFFKFLTAAAKDDKILDPYEVKVKSVDYFYTIGKVMKEYTFEAAKQIDNAELKRSSEFFSGALVYRKAGREEFKKVLGYKEYLSQYSSHNSVNVFDYDGWENLIRYSVIFKNTDKVKTELGKVYPTAQYNISDYCKNLVYAEQAAKIMAKSIKHGEENYRSGSHYTGYYRTTSYRGSSYRGSGGGFRGGGGRSGGGTR